MRVDVALAPSELTPGVAAGKVVAVVDVLRASTTIAACLAHGAKTVVPLMDADEALTRAKQLDRSQLVLAGERRNVPIPGFDLGNSPGEFTEQRVRGKTVFITTTNGTAALVSLQGAVDIVVGAYVNVTAVSAFLKVAARGGRDILIVCAGTEGHFCLEDAACAGRYVRALSRGGKAAELNDAAFACALIDEGYGDNIQKVFEDSEHGATLAQAGFGADLVTCAAVDSFPVVPVYQERQITRLGPDRER